MPTSPIRHLRQKVLSTERKLLEPICTFVEHPGALAFYSTRYPRFYYGNGILVRDPDQGDRAWWEELFDSMVQSEPEHRLFVFESEHRSALLLKEFRREGYAMYRERYMTRNSPFRLSRRNDVIVEHVNETGEWDRLELMQAQIDEDLADTASLSDEMRMLLRKKEEVSRGLDMQWYMLRNRKSGDYVASAGIFRHGEIGRLQGVVTPPRFRRKGYAEYLLRSIVNDALASDEIGAVALCCDRGTGAERMYLNMEFKPIAATASCLKV